jgi:hypothetical protein
MAPLAKRVLALDHRIGSALVIDRKGHLLEFETATSEMPIPESVVRTLGGVWSAVVAQIVEKLEQFFGPTAHVSIRMQKLDIHGLLAGKDLIILTARRDLPEEILDKVQALQP